MRSRLFAFLAILVFLSAPLQAQTAGPSSKLGFDVTGPATVAEANAMIVKAYVDNATTGTTLSGLACVAGTTTGTFACTAALPALTPGAHTLTATVTMGALESAKSSSVGFAYVVLAILNLKIV